MANSNFESSIGFTPAADWHSLYQEAILELDSAKLPQRVSRARRAILDRAEEVLTAAAPTDERMALNDALRALRVIEGAATKKDAAA